MARKRGPARATRGTLLEALGEVLVWSTLVWAVFALGGTTGVAVVGLWALANLSLVVNILARRFRPDAGVIVLVSLAGWTLFQSAPLPIRAVAVFDSDVAQTWAQTFELLGKSGPAALSLQPHTTRLEAMKLWAYAVTWGCAAGLVARRGSDFVVRTVVWLVVAVVAVTLFHSLMGWQRVYAWYEPQHVAPRWVGPLLNMNNLGGLCNLGVFAALALTFRGSGNERGWLVFISIALGLCVMTLLTGSRGAIGALGLGVLAFAFLVWRNRAALSMRRFGVVVVVGVGLILAVIVLDQERLLGDLADRSTEKVRVIGWAVDVLRAHGFWGVGKGALQAEIPVVQPRVGALLFPYVECFPMDWATGWGVPIATVVLALVLGALVKLRGGFRTNILRCALGIVLIQNLFDLGFEVPGLVLPWLFVWVAVRKPAVELLSLTPSKKGIGLAVSLASMAAVLALGVPIHAAAETRGQLARKIAAGARVEVAELYAALTTNPGDHALLRMTAMQSALLGQPKTMAWVNLALLRAPTCALTYLSLGQLLWSQGAKQQALLAFRRAAADPLVNDELETWLVAREPTLLVEVASRDLRGAEFLRRVASRQSDPAVQRQLFEAALVRAPTDVATRLDYVEWQVGAAVRGIYVTCTSREECVVNLLQQVNVLESLPELGADLTRRVLVLNARVRSLQGDSLTALTELLPICRAAPADLKCAEVALELGRKVGGATFDEVSAAYLDVFCQQSERCVSERIHVASDLASNGRLTAALQHYIAAAAANTDPRAFAGAAEVAARLGREHEALHWLTKGEQRFGANPTFEAQRQRLGIPPKAAPAQTPAPSRPEE